MVTKKVMWFKVVNKANNKELFQGKSFSLALTIAFMFKRNGDDVYIVAELTEASYTLNRRFVHA